MKTNKYFRLEVVGKEVGYINKTSSTLLVTTNPYIVWSLWFGFESVDVYEVEGAIVTDNTCNYEDEDGVVFKVEDYVVVVSSIKKVGTMKMDMS